MPVHERRGLLVEAALRVVARDGVAGATTRRIAEAAGAPLASLHYSFGSKEELLLAALDYGVERTNEQVAEHAPPPGAGLRGAVAAYLELFRAWALAERELMVAQFGLLTWLLGAGDRAGEAARVYRDYIDGLTRILAAAATSEERDVDLRALARATVAMTDGMILQLITVGPVAGDPLTPSAIADGLLRAVHRAAGE